MQNRRTIPRGGPKPGRGHQIAVAPASKLFMPDAGDEQDLPPLFPLSELPRRPWMPKRRGKPISFSTCLRWATREGSRGL
jgi:hypothetical protein